MAGSRAEYLRNYRAAKRELEQRRHVCEQCGTAFETKRADARFCSAACRAGKWRPIKHEVLQSRPGGIELKPEESGYPGLKTCLHQNADGSFCGETARWLHEWFYNHDRGVRLRMELCDEHRPEDVEHVDIRLETAAWRDARKARTQHGKLA